LVLPVIDVPHELPAVTVVDQDLPYIPALQNGFTETPENRCESGKLTTPRSTCEQLRPAWITIAGRFGKPPSLRACLPSKQED